MANISLVKIKEKTRNKISIAISCFWTGFVVYSISYTIDMSGSVNFKICFSLQILGFLLMVPSAAKLMQWKFYNNYLKILFSIYIFWMLTVIIRGFFFDYRFLMFLFFNAMFGIFLYFAPLVLLFSRSSLNYKKAFDVIFILGISYVVLVLVFLKDLIYPFDSNLSSASILEYFSLNLSLPSGLFLLTYTYHSNKRRLLALAVIILTFILSVINARRGLMFMSLSVLLFSYFIYLFTNKGKLVKFLFALILMVFIIFWGAKTYNEYQNSLFAYITERLFENTRTGVEESFYNDMNTVDWIIGRGINGQYFHPGIDGNNFNLNGYRDVIETGYLQIILKGGLISLGLLLLILIPALFKGIFFSKNSLSKAAGIWIFLFLIFSYPAIITTFTMHYLLVWISVGICYSKNIRNIPESTIIRMFQN